MLVELLIPVPLGMHKCQSPTPLTVALNLNRSSTNKQKNLIDQKQKGPTPPTITAGMGMCSELRKEGKREGLSQKRDTIKNKEISQVHQEDQTAQFYTLLISAERGKSNIHLWHVTGNTALYNCGIFLFIKGWRASFNR